MLLYHQKIDGFRKSPAVWAQNFMATSSEKGSIALILPQSAYVRWKDTDALSELTTLRVRRAIAPGISTLAAQLRTELETAV